MACCVALCLSIYARAPPVAAANGFRRLRVSLNGCYACSGDENRVSSRLKPVRRFVEAQDLPFLDYPKRDRFLLLSYNILGDENVKNHRDLYRGVPFDILKWDLRKRLICREIIGWNADFVCLQEVDKYYDILSTLRRKGYSGSYKRRTGGAKDGCAVFWKEDRFRILDWDTIEFRSFGLRDNVAQLFVFESLEADSRRLMVGNIHVLFNPNRGDVKLGQIRMLLMKANALSNKWNGIPVVLSGDFNSTPDSAIYEFLLTSELDVTLHDRRYLSGQNRGDFPLYDITSCMKYNWTNEELCNALGTSDCTRLRHPLHLRSSYASVKGNGNTRDRHGEPSATSSHSKFLGTVDYIWYSIGLICSRVLDTLPVDTLRKLGGLPTKDIGSDHLALVSELIFTESVKKLMEPLPDLTEKDDTLHGRLHPG